MKDTFPTSLEKTVLKASLLDRHQLYVGYFMKQRNTLKKKHQSFFLKEIHRWTKTLNIHACPWKGTIIQPSFLRVNSYKIPISFGHHFTWILAPTSSACKLKKPQQLPKSNIEKCSWNQSPFGSFVGFELCFYLSNSSYEMTWNPDWFEASRNITG